MEQVRVNGVIYAISDNIKNAKKGSRWYSIPGDFLQLACMKVNKDRKYLSHHHLIRPRVHLYTQECLFCCKGKARVKVFDNNKELIKEFVLTPGSFVLLLEGGHGLEILKNDTILLEFKNGDFCGVQEDKAYI